MFLYKRKDRSGGHRYWIGWSEKGIAHRRPLHKYLNLPFPVRDKVTANQLLLSLQMNEIRGHLGLPVESSAPMVKDFYLDYFRFCDRNKTLNTIRADSYRFKKWLSFLEDHQVQRISGITPRVLNEFLHAHLKDKKNATINKYVSIIRASLQWGVRQGLLKENLLKNMPRLAEKRLPRPASFREGDLEKLFSIDDKIFAVYIKVIYYTLMRRTEALSLTWDDVDFKKRVIRIRETKNQLPRSVPIADKLRKALQTLPRKQGRLFPGWKQHSVTTKFRRLKEKLGLNIDGIHHFRHLGASKLLQMGENPRVVQELLGHKTVNTTMRIYAHVLESATREAVEKL